MNDLSNNDDTLRQEVKNILHDELSHFLSDIEFRLAQDREYQARITQASPGPNTVFAEDINVGRHQITGYTVTANTPGAGSIAWTSVHVVYNGVDYACADGNTAKKYTWFVKPGSGTSATLQSGDAKPTLGAGDCLLFVNTDGTPTSVLEASIPATIADNAVGANEIVPGGVGSAELADGAVTASKTSFYSALVASITDAQNAADLAQATADGAISTYFQSGQPWANGTTQDPAKVGDIWYDADDGHAYRWSGGSGTPVNTWVPITDTDVTTALANAAAAQTTADSKITTFYAASTSVPSAITIGDLWVVTDQGNLLKRANAKGTAGWVSVQLGDAALSGISGSKVGTGIDASNVTTGTLAGTRVGTGINGSNITTGTVAGARIGSGVAGANIVAGSITNTQLGNNAVTASKLNVLQHFLY